MESLNVDSENKMDKALVNENSLNTSKKSDREESTTSDRSKTENPILLPNEINSQIKISENGEVRVEQLEIENKNLHSILESSLKTINDIKITISEFEKSCMKITKLSPINCKNINQDIDLMNLLRHYGNLRKFQEAGSHNELIQRNNSRKTARYESFRKAEDNLDSNSIDASSTNIRKSKTISKRFEKVQKTYSSESLTESEEQQSDDSIYDPSIQNTKYGGDYGRSRGRPKRTVKSGRKSRGRPRKQHNTDESSNSRGRPRKYFTDDFSSVSHNEPIIKRSRGRPRKTVNEEDDESSESEPPVKKSRGRPKKSIVEDQSSNSLKDSKDNGSNNLHDSDSVETKEKDSTNSNEQETTVFDRPTLSDKSQINDLSIDDGEIAVKKHKGRPRKNFNNDSENQDKKPRGRPKTKTNFDSKKELSDNLNADSSFVNKSRGRPKKITNVIENENSVEST